MRLLLFVCSLLFSLAGCSERATETVTPPGVEPSPGAGASSAVTVPAGAATQPVVQSSAAGGAGAGVGTSTPGLQLLPEAPRAVDTLMACFGGGSGAVTYIWRNNGQVLVEGSSDRLAPAGWRRGDTVSVTVRDARGEQTASRSVVNSPPTVRDVALANPTLHRGVDIVLQPVGEDADGDEVAFTYSWLRNGEPINGYLDAVLPGDLFVRDDRISFVVTPIDDAGPGEPYISGDIVIPNAPPVFTSTPPTSFSAQLYSYTPIAKDVDGDVISYSLDGAPPGATIDSANGRLQWNLVGVAAGSYTISIVADDGAGLKAYQEYSVTLGEPQGR